MNPGTFEVELTVLSRNELVAVGSSESNLAIRRSAQGRETTAAKTKAVSSMGSSKYREPYSRSHGIPSRIEVEFANAVVNPQPSRVSYFWVACAGSITG
jgi:hypothetical protein